MISHYWYPHQGTLARDAYHLTLRTFQGWHVGVSVCSRCHHPRHLWAAVCPEMLTAVPQATSEPHDPPPPPGRLL